MPNLFERGAFKGVPRELWLSYSWQIQNRIKTQEELSRYINLTNEELRGIRLTKGLYPMAITPYYLSLIDPEDVNDPVRLQAIPRDIEVSECQNLGEENPFREESEISGLTHRYPDRVLLNLTSFCAVYCRHCMRKRIFAGGEASKTKEEINSWLSYIKKHESIRDVLISGGEPLSVGLEKLEYLLKSLREIKHIQTIRFGTRLLVLCPQRFFDREVLDLLERYSPIWINTHFNHPNEITELSAMAVEKLLRAGIPVNNQTVLLKGVNDRPEVMLELFRALLRIKVRPIYLFHCDPIKGAIHFRTSVEKGLEIMRFLRGKLPGMGIPHYAIDLPEGKGKVTLSPDYLKRREGSKLVFESPLGGLIEYEILEI
ncbi:MAG: KamA family radical SAM protein [Aquificaceae bacterium]